MELPLAMTLVLQENRLTKYNSQHQVQNSKFRNAVSPTNTGKRYLFLGLYALDQRDFSPERAA